MSASNGKRHTGTIAFPEQTSTTRHRGPHRALLSEPPRRCSAPKTPPRIALSMFGTAPHPRGPFPRHRESRESGHSHWPDSVVFSILDALRGARTHGFATRRHIRPDPPCPPRDRQGLRGLRPLFAHNPSRGPNRLQRAPGVARGRRGDVRSVLVADESGRV